MNYGLYTAYLGMRARMRTLDIIANNIANSSTTGFKADHLTYESVEAEEAETTPSLQPSRALGVMTGGMLDFSTGSLRQTGGSLDVALAGDGFMVVQTPRGERYTRGGALKLDSSGQLVTAQGDLVTGDGGPITLPPGEVSIGEDGSISVAGQVAGRLKLVQFANPRTELIKEGETLFLATGGGPSSEASEATQTRVLQGMLESSNVNPVEEMAAMMQNSREFESLQRSVTQLMSLRKIAAEIGKI